MPVQLTLLVESMMRAVSPVAKVAPGQGCPWENLDNHEDYKKVKVKECIITIELI